MLKAQTKYLSMVIRNNILLYDPIKVAIPPTIQAVAMWSRLHWKARFDNWLIKREGLAVVLPTLAP